MKFRSRICLVVAAIVALTPARAQGDWSDLGLSGHSVSRLRSGYGWLYACTSNGLHRKNSVSADSAWTLLGFAGQTVLDVIAISPDTLLTTRDITGIGADSVAIFRSTDGGSSWSQFQNGLGAGSTSAGDRKAQILLRPSWQPPVLFATLRGGIVRSTDDGLTWTKTALSGNRYLFIVEREGTIFAGGENNIFTPFVRRSTNGGLTWSFVYSSSFDDWATGVAFDPGDPNAAYLRTTSGLFRSDNNGTSWSQVPIALGSGVTAAGIWNRAYSALRLYAGGSGPPYGVKIVWSDDGGMSWLYSAYLGVADGSENFILVNSGESSDSLFVATGNGVLRYITEAVVGVRDPKRASALKLEAHPTSVSDRTEFAIQIPATSNVTLRVLDIRGAAVAALFSGELPPGRHQISWTPAGLPAGVYFAELRAGRTAKSQKLLVIR